MIYNEEVVKVKTMKNQVVCIKLFSFVLFLVLLSGCVRRPLLLRNRPNVPPPSLDPESDEMPLVAGPPLEMYKVPPPFLIEQEQKEIKEVVPEIKTSSLTHEVKKGDSFWKIARMYGVTNTELAACNNLPLDKPLKIGTVLVIPPGGVANYNPPKIKTATAKPKKKTVTKKTVKPIKVSNGGTYIVQPGDSLWKIARRANITTKALINANGLDPKRPLRIGQELVIPGGSSNMTTTKPKTKPEKEVKKVEEVEVIEEKVNPIDDLLKDAEKAAGEDKESSDDPTEVLSGLDKAAETTEIPLADDLYTEEVLPNETLQEIAERHGLKVEDILKVNPGIKPGQKLKPFSSIKIPSKKY